jgi:hypothetical protein
MTGTTGSWKATECRKMHGKDGTSIMVWWGWEFTVNQIRRREGKKKTMMRTRTRAVDPLPHRNWDSGIVLLRMAFNPEGKKGFWGLDRRRPLARPGPVPKVPRFCSVRFRIAGRERNSVASTWRAAASITLPSRPKDENDAQEMTVGPVVVPGASNIAARVPRVHFVPGKGAGSRVAGQMSIVVHNTGRGAWLMWRTWRRGIKVFEWN